MRTPTFIVTALLVILGTTSAPRFAAADPVAETTPALPNPLIPVAPPPAPQDGGGRRWYGWQMIGVDLAAGTVVGLGLALENTPANDAKEKTLIGAGAALYLIGAPLVHLGHGQARRSGTSLLMRVGLPLIGAAGGYILGSPAAGDDGPPARFALSLVGAGVGGITALVVDDLVLGWEPQHDAPTWAPTLSPTTSGGMTLGVVGLW